MFLAPLVASAMPNSKEKDDERRTISFNQIRIELNW
jgi:hypothetical protein